MSNYMYGFFEFLLYSIFNEIWYICHSLKKSPTLSEKQIFLSYAYHVEEYKILFPTSTPAVA